MISIFVGLAGVIIGALMVWRPNIFLEMIGEQAWMNKMFSSSISGYKLLGIIIIIISFLIMTGMIKGIILWFFAPTLSMYR